MLQLHEMEQLCEAEELEVHLSIGQGHRQSEEDPHDLLREPEQQKSILASRLLPQA